MMRRNRLLLGSAAAGLLILLAALLSRNPLPSLESFEAGEWTRIEPGGETRCAAGTPFAFFVRPADPQRLMIYFQGGGMCWNASMCDVPGETNTFDPYVEALDVYGAGIFEAAQAENPLADFSIVFVPYCTGDLFTGSRDAVYQTPSGALTIYHRGVVNAQAALDWTFANFPQPEQIFITGTSAGSIGSIFHADRIMTHYPASEIVQLGDSYAGIFSAEWNGPQQWGLQANLPAPLQENPPPPDEIFAALYRWTAQRHPQHLFAQVSSAADLPQLNYYASSGKNIDREAATERIPALLRGLAADLPNFRYFLIAGDDHAMLMVPQFYTYQSGEIWLKDWLAALLDRRAGNTPAP